MDLAFADVCGTGLTGNAALINEQSGQLSNRTSYEDSSEFTSSRGRMSFLSPVRPEYGTIEARLASFNSSDWPSASCPVDVHLLAAAGFYNYGNFAGYADSVKCYHCDIGLCKWQPGDDAWLEHSRTSPHCIFIHNLRNKNQYRALKNQLPLTVTDPSSLPSTPEELSDDDQHSPSTPPQSSCTLIKQNHETETSTNTTTSTSTSDKRATSNISGVKNSLCSHLTCKVCYLRDLSVLFLPCRHLVSCAPCAAELRKCPTCRQPIQEAIDIYIS